MKREGGLIKHAEPIAAELEDDEAAQFHRTIANLLDGSRSPTSSVPTATVNR